MAALCASQCSLGPTYAPPSLSAAATRLPKGESAEKGPEVVSRLEIRTPVPFSTGLDMAPVTWVKLEGRPLGDVAPRAGKPED
jgi:hypothetical protein